MIDIHNHTLFGVDDGPKDISVSIEMLRKASAQNITDIILTPHYRSGMFPYKLDDILAHFDELEDCIRAERIPIRLHLGCEYHVNDKMIDYLASGRVRTMADGDYVLTEYSYDTPYSYIYEQTRLLRRCRYIPVIAHVERYDCLVRKPKLCEELQEVGALIQCNANALLGLEDRAAQKMILKLLKHEWVDIVASDTHDLEKRVSHMKEAYFFVSKKYDADYAKWLFEESPGRLLAHVSL